MKRDGSNNIVVILIEFIGGLSLLSTPQIRIFVSRFGL